MPNKPNINLSSIFLIVDTVRSFKIHWTQLDIFIKIHYRFYIKSGKITNDG